MFDEPLAFGDAGGWAMVASQEKSPVSGRRTRCCRRELKRPNRHASHRVFPVT